MIYQFVTRGGRPIGRQVQSPRSLRQGERFRINGVEHAVAGVGPEHMVQWPQADGMMTNTSMAVVTVGTVAELGLPVPLEFTF